MQVIALFKNMSSSHVLEQRCTLKARLVSQCVSVHACIYIGVYIEFFDGGSC